MIVPVPVRVPLVAPVIDDRLIVKLPDGADNTVGMVIEVVVLPAKIVRVPLVAV